MGTKLVGHARTDNHQGFHSDSGDNVSLYCRQRAAVGGELYLASAWQVYNQLATHHLENLRVMAAPWAWQESRRYATIYVKPRGNMLT
jgi:hypothetical protein